MSSKKLEPKEMGLILSKTECIRIANGVLSDTKDKQKRARSAESKRAIKKSIEFWEAIVYHLSKEEEEQQ